MNIGLSQKLIALAALVVAVWLGGSIAAGDYGIPALAAAVTTGACLVMLLRVPIDTILLGAILFGYLVGNRGFAQLMPVPGIPLLPAEIALIGAGSWMLMRSAFSRSVPIGRDWLNVAVLAWLIAGTVRVFFDVRTFGLVAIRDYAMVYYAAFFFIGQACARASDRRRFLLLVLVAASVAQPIAFLLTEAFPVFMLTNLTIRGVPLVYFKGDLGATFMAMSAVVLFYSARGLHRFWAWPLATAQFLYVVIGENRASMLGALVALAWLSLRKRLFPLVQGTAVVFGLVVLVGMATFTEHSWSQRRLHGLTERVSSLVDVMGGGTYVSEESLVKGDNNRFRSMWWSTVIDETLKTNPVFGLGFGYDLARGFLQEYNPEMAEDFVTRSPHSILVSVFGRMGFIGLAIFTFFVAVLFRKTWRIMRDASADPTTLILWASVWIILTSACFGVVLEGPMGAVVFWTVLGLANALADAKADPEPTATPESSDPLLHASKPGDELASAS